MPAFRVSWEIDVEVPDEGSDFDQALHAAQLARAMQDIDTTALCFLACPLDSKHCPDIDRSHWINLDLSEYPEAA